ncbi:hypothetical protein D3C81_2009220 [compost metagenome]
MEHGGIGAHLAVGRVKIDITGAAIIAGDVGKYLGQVALYRCGHDRLRCYCHYFLSQPAEGYTFPANNRPKQNSIGHLSIIRSIISDEQPAQ